MFTEKNKIQITLIEKKPSYVWCDTRCYFVDDTGMIYEESPQFTSGVFLTFFGGTPHEDIIKSHFITEEQFTRMLRMVTSLEELLFRVTSITFGEDINLNIESIKNIPLRSPATLLVTKEAPLEDIVSSLSLLVKDKAFTETLTTKALLLQYIDARFPDKIYYKFETSVTQSSTPPSQEDTSTTNATLLETTQ